MPGRKGDDRHTDFVGRIRAFGPYGHRCQTTFAYHDTKTPDTKSVTPTDDAPPTDGKTPSDR